MNRRYALIRGVQLILYGLSNKLPILKKLSIVKKAYRETMDHAVTLAKLDRLAMVGSIFGIRPKILKVFPEAELLDKFGADVRQHWHIGDNADPDRVRIWVPSLVQGRHTWNYDRNFLEYGRDFGIKLKDGEKPVFHVARIEGLTAYIDFLYWVLIEEGQIYESRALDTK